MLELEAELILDGTFVLRAAEHTDVVEAVALFNECSRTMMGIEGHDVDDVRNEWHTPGFDLESATRVALTPEGRLVGYVEVWDVAENPVTPWVWGRVHPDFEGQGIGSALMVWAEDRAREAIERVPDGAQVAMNCGTVSTYEPPKRLFTALGLTNHRQFWDMAIELDAPIPKPKWPKGIRLSTYAARPDLKALSRAVEEAFADHYGHVERSEDEGLERWKHWIEGDKEIDPTLWFLAMDGEEIAGASLCRPRLPGEPDTGHVNTLGVRRPWRRQGLALALLHHTFGEFRRRGQRRVTLGVDSESLTGATRLYEKAGMHIDKRFDAYEKVLRPGKELSKQSLDD